MARVACTFLLAAIAGSSGFRIRDKRRSTRGSVAGLYLWGAPEVGKPGLTSFGGCFPGVHAVTAQTETVLGRPQYQIDLVPKLARKVGYESGHTKLIVLDYNGSTPTWPCEARHVLQARGKWQLHNIDQYYNLMAASESSAFEVTMAFFALYTAGENDDAKAKAGVEAQGWRLVGTARHEGDPSLIGLGGPQVQHLVQHPTTLNCALTFQFTKVREDWYNNLDIRSISDFCALPNRAHRGLVRALRMTTNSSDWQNNIRPKLQHCKDVFAVGHSQGGAQAELWSACMNQHNPPVGDADYAGMSWMTGEVKPLFS